jgi:hypothetical protein
MKLTQRFHDPGQSLWLDNVTRDLMTSRTLEHYIKQPSVTGLTSNLTIFGNAIQASHSPESCVAARHGRRQFRCTPATDWRRWGAPTHSGRIRYEPLECRATVRHGSAHLR